jgi:hypothetical protein
MLMSTEFDLRSRIPAILISNVIEYYSTVVLESNNCSGFSQDVRCWNGENGLDTWLLVLLRSTLVAIMGQLLVCRYQLVLYFKCLIRGSAFE